MLRPVHAAAALYVAMGSPHGLVVAANCRFAWNLGGGAVSTGSPTAAVAIVARHCWFIRGSTRTREVIFLSTSVVPIAIFLERGECSLGFLLRTLSLYQHGLVCICLATLASSIASGISMRNTSRTTPPHNASRSVSKRPPLKQRNTGIRNVIRQLSRSLQSDNESHTATAHISASSVKEGVVGRASAANSRSLMPKSTLALATKTGFQSFEVSVLPVSVTSALPHVSTTQPCYNAFLLNASTPFLPFRCFNASITIAAATLC